MTRKRILITGASGCVGHYLVEDLLRNSEHELVLVLRDPAKLQLNVAGNERVRIIPADMTDVGSYAGNLGRIDAALLVAAAWGGNEAFAVNYTANLALADALIEQGCPRILYFSSASVLQAEGLMLPEAKLLGSDYIRSKYDLVEAMEKRAEGADIVGLFPTLVLGGDPDKPVSHFARLLRQAAPWAWLAKLLRADGKFHFIHARDIAIVARKLIDADFPAGIPQRIVLGNPAMTVNAFVDGFAAHIGARRAPFTVTLRDSFAEFLIRVFRIKLSPWDRYCMEHRDLSFRDARNPAAFGEAAFTPDLPSALDSIGVTRRR